MYSAYWVKYGDLAPYWVRVCPSGFKVQNLTED